MALPAKGSALVTATRQLRLVNPADVSGSAEAFASLHQGYSANELRDLWPEILTEAFTIIQQNKFARA